MRSGKITALFLSILICIFTLACQADKLPTDIPETQAPDLTQVCLTAARGGNLHYNNFLLADGEFLYYTDNDGYLVKRDLNNQRIIKMGEYSAGNLVLSTDTLYFTRGIAGGHLNKIDLDGTNQVRIGRSVLKQLILVDEWIYGIDTEKGSAIKMRTDGSGKTETILEGASDLYYDLQKIYITRTAAAGGVTVLDLLTGDTHQIINHRVASLNAAGNWIYYINPEAQNRPFAYSIDAEQSWQIGDFSLEKPFIINSGYLYALAAGRQNRLYRWSVRGRSELRLEQAELIIDDAVDMFVVCHDRIYYRRPGCSRIYVQMLDQSRPERFS